MLSPVLPLDLVMEADELGYKIFEPATRSLVGSHTFPCLTDDGRLTFAQLEVPSDGRFDQDDLVELRHAGSRMADWLKARRAVLLDHDSYATPTVVGYVDSLQDWRALTACAEHAIALLSRWPTELTRSVRWMPVGLPGGVEDLRRTILDVERRGNVAPGGDGGVTISHSARSVGAARGVANETVAALASAVVNAALAALPAEQRALLAPALRPIGEVARRAQPTVAHDAPDISSWPPRFVEFADSCARALVEIEAATAGHGATPLLDTHELYEQWLAVHALDVIELTLGPSSGRTSIGALASWQHGSATVDLWFKPAFPQGGRSIGSFSLRPVAATTLVPDVVVTVTEMQETRLHVLDAKSWRSMQPEDALTQSAKYLYGLRRLDALGRVPAISSVHLVTSAPRPTLVNLNDVPMDVITAHPAGRTGALDSLIERLVTL